MAQFPAIRERIKALLEQGLAHQALTVHATIPGTTPEPPAIVVRLASASYDDPVNTRGLDRYEVDLQVMVPSGDAALAQELLDEFLTDQGPNSIRQVIDEHRDLGLDDGTSAHIDGMTYGLTFGREQDLAHLGAALRLVVLTTG